MAVLGGVLEINEEEIHVVGKFTDTFYIIMYVMTCKMFDISKNNNTTGIIMSSKYQNEISNILLVTRMFSNSL